MRKSLLPFAEGGVWELQLAEKPATRKGKLQQEQGYHSRLSRLRNSSLQVEEAIPPEAKGVRVLGRGDCRSKFSGGKDNAAQRTRPLV